MEDLSMPMLLDDAEHALGPLGAIMLGVVGAALAVMMVRTVFSMRKVAYRFGPYDRSRRNSAVKRVNARGRIGRTKYVRVR